MRRAVLAALLVIGLVGCKSSGSGSGSKPDPRLISVGVHDMGVYTVDTPIEWTREEREPETWTVDGLETLRFREIESDQGIFRRTGNRPIKPFKEGMRPTEIATLYVESLAVARGLRVFQWSNLAPVDFGSWNGFSFDFEYETPQGLSMLGMAIGAVIDGKLHLIVYAAPRDYYFDKYREDVRDIFESIAPS